MTIVELCRSLKCSIHTIRKRLKLWGTYSSYNKNGRYYTLTDIPSFNENGLWSCQGVRFSRNGTLVKTVVELLNNSQHGLSWSEIGLAVGLNPRSFMNLFRNNPNIFREKIDGKYIYFSADESKYLDQKQNRLCSSESLTKLPPDSTAIEILVDIIKHPQTNLDKCIKRLCKKGTSIETKTVKSLLDYHHITLKKTADTNT